MISLIPPTSFNSMFLQEQDNEISKLIHRMMNPTDLFFALSDSQYEWGEEGLPCRRILVELHRTAYALAIAATQPCNNPVKDSAWLQNLNHIWHILAVLERPYCVQAFYGVSKLFQATCICVRAFCVLKKHSCKHPQMCQHVSIMSTRLLLRLLLPTGWWKAPLQILFVLLEQFHATNLQKLQILFSGWMLFAG